VSAPRASVNATPIRSQTFDEASRLLRTAALARAIDEPRGDDRIVPLLQGRFALRGHTVDVAVDTEVRVAAHDLLTRGWTPGEVHTFAERRLDSVSLAYLIDALAATAQYSAGVPWLPELTALSARVWWSVGEPHFAQWTARHDRRRADAMRVVVDVLALLSYLPRTDAVQPEAPQALAIPRLALVQDDRIIGKINALLSRAGATTFPEEASACAAKAQELMVRYATVPDPAPATVAASATAAALRRLCTESPAATVRAVAASRLADPARLVATVGEEVAGLVQRATAVVASGTAAAWRAATQLARPRPMRQLEGASSVP
jgi:hypothetical protein